MTAITFRYTAGMRALTKRQQKMLELIGTHVQKHGYPPTRRELARSMAISPRALTGVGDHLRAIERKGYITLTPYLSRGIALTALGRSRLGLPEHRAVVWVDPAECAFCHATTFAPDQPCPICRFAPGISA